MMPHQASGPEPEPLTWDELDLLADWTDGQLTGPDADHIAHLVATDPRWTHAHTTITTNQPTITNALTTAAPTPHEPIPPDILTRLTNALDAATPPVAERHDHVVARRSAEPRPFVSRPADSRPAQARPPDSRPAARPSPGAGPSSGAPPSSGPGPSTRSRRRRPVIAGIATVLLLVCGFGGFRVLVRTTGSAEDAGTYNAQVDSRAPLESAASGETPPSVRSPLIVIATGTDYTADTLAAFVAPRPSGELAPSESLEPLIPLERLLRCFDAIKARYPGTPEAVDFASFEGQPAAVVLWAGTDGLMVIAVRADCDAGDAGILAVVDHT